MRKLLSTSLLIFSTLFLSKAQDPFSGQFLFLKNLDTTYLELDCYEGDCDVFFQNVILFKKLETLKIEGLRNDKYVSYLRFLPELESLEITDSKISERKLVNALTNCLNLRSLSLPNNGISRLPNNFSKLSNLEYVNLSKNYIDLNYSFFLEVLWALDLRTFSEIKQVNYENYFKHLSRLPVLDSLDISLNHTPLHYSINELDTLTYLNISGVTPKSRWSSLRSWLTIGMALTTPEDRASMRPITLKVNTLELQSNDFWNYRALGLYPSTQLLANYRYFSLPEYQSLFGSFEPFWSNPYQDIGSYRFTYQRDTVEQTGQEIINYGEFRTNTSNNVRVKSSAYLYYAQQRRKLRKNYDIDTTSFADRYSDPRYSGSVINTFQIKKDTPIPRGFLSKRKIKKLYNQHARKLAFDVKRLKNGDLKLIFKTYEKGWFLGKKTGDFGMYLAREHREIVGLRNRNWILVNATPEQKKKLLTGAWNDVRLRYNESSALFTMELKSPEGFETFTVDISLNDTTKRSERALRAFKNYTKSLERRESSFEKKRNRAIGKYRRLGVSKKEWRKFRRKYMSNDEKKMSFEAWENYYEAVIQNEYQALLKGKIEMPLIKRAMELNGYKELNAFEWSKYYPETENLKCSFRQEGKKPFRVTECILIDRKNGAFVNLNGDYSNLCYIPFPNDTTFNTYDIVVRLKDDEFAVVKDIRFDGQNDIFSMPCHVTFEVSLLPRHLSDIRLVFDELNLN